MATFTEHAGHGRFARYRGSRTVVAWLVLTLLVCLPGCGGCNKTADELEKEKQQAEEKAKKKKEEEKPFEAGLPRALPTNSASRGLCKPGHWISQTWPEVKSNLGDFQGEVQTEVVDSVNRRTPLVAVPYEISNERPAALAKQQPKALESCLLIPTHEVKHNDNADPDTSHNPASVNFRLTTAGGGATAIEQSMILTSMPSYRYFFVLLSRGSRFEYVDKRLDSVRLHRSRLEGDNGPKFYEVVTMPAGRRPSLPNNSLCWTSIAYLLWDDSDPASWDIDQQQALIDWLHWGGQIIVSGPDALEQLHDSFLRPYLPATVQKSRTFADTDLAPLQYWAGDFGHPPIPVRPWPGAELTIDPQATYLPHTGNTIVERRVGRGRIVVSAFRITGPEFTGWEGCDCFFNACLMRRPPRDIVVDSDTKAVVGVPSWVETSAVRQAKESKAKEKKVKAVVDPTPATQAGPPAPVDDPADPTMANIIGNDNPTRPADQTTDEPNGTLADAAANTAVRYFSRDAGVEFRHYAADIVTLRAQARQDYYGSNGYGYTTVPPGAKAAVPESDEMSTAGEGDYGPAPENAPGLGAWNDFSPVAAAARSAITHAASITVPERSFIVWVVAGYLCVLVPANWLVFRLIGRVEWAWIAAPLIAIGCTVVVIRQAQLNIGFARSRNEIAVIEMQPGYSRAHVTRYTVLYTSLATRYEFHVSDPAGQVLPFPRVSDPKAYKPGVWDSRHEVVCRRGDDTQLMGFNVSSNTKDYMHSEEMADIGGTLTLRRDSDGILRVTNGTKHPLENCRVVRGEKSGTRLASIDRLDPGATATLTFKKSERGQSAETEASRKSSEPSGELSAEGVAQVALARQELLPNEVCLVARVADDIPGLTVLPAAQQTRQAALLVAHLDAGQLPEPVRDQKHRATEPREKSLKPGPRGAIPDDVVPDNGPDEEK